MDMRYIINAINGEDDKGRSRAAFTLLSEIYDIPSGELETVGSMSLYKPKFKIERHGKYVQADILFMSHLDTDLAHVMFMLNQFGSNCFKYDESDDKRPVLSLTIVPVALGGRAYIQAMNPIMWVKTTDTISGSELNTIRILFESIDFNAFEDPDADPEKTERELEREEEHERQLNDLAEKERNDVIEKNKKAEELRREEYLIRTLDEDAKIIRSFKELDA